MAGRVSRSETAWSERVALAEALGAAVMVDMKGPGAFPTDHPLMIAPPAPFPGAAAKDMLRAADVVLNLNWYDLNGTLKQAWGQDPIGSTIINVSNDQYVHNGWNLTGDDFVRDTTGVFHFAARADDMIISSGYNIAGPEVEAALLSHAHVAECAVVGAPDDERGQIVEAHVMLREGVAGDDACVKALQDHVKATIAPYKYPRSVKFVAALPKTQTGKIQRFKLKA